MEIARYLISIDFDIPLKIFLWLFLLTFIISFISLVFPKNYSFIKKIRHISSIILLGYVLFYISIALSTRFIPFPAQGGGVVEYSDCYIQEKFTPYSTSHCYPNTMVQGFPFIYVADNPVGTMTDNPTGIIDSDDRWNYFNFYIDFGFSVFISCGIFALFFFWKKKNQKRL